MNGDNADGEAIASSEEEIQFKTIEDLLKTDDFVEMYDVPPETNVPANVKALRLALDNPLVFNESTKLPTEIKYKRPSQVYIASFFYISASAHSYFKHSLECLQLYSF